MKQSELVATGAATQGPPSAASVLTSDLRPPRQTSVTSMASILHYLICLIQLNVSISKVPPFKLSNSHSHTLAPVFGHKMKKSLCVTDIWLIEEGVDRRGREVLMILRSLSVQAVNPQTVMKLKTYSLFFWTKNVCMCIQLGTTPPSIYIVNPNFINIVSDQKLAGSKHLN